MNNFVKQAYVQGLAARAILRARIMQKRAGIGDYALAGGVGAGGGAIIGALVNAARKKNMLSGALAGAGIGGVAGLGYQGVKDLLKGKADPVLTTKGNDNFFRKLNREPQNVIGPEFSELDTVRPIQDVTDLKNMPKNTQLSHPNGVEGLNKAREDSKSDDANRTSRWFRENNPDYSKPSTKPVVLGNGLVLDAPAYPGNPDDLPLLDLPGLSE